MEHVHRLVGQYLGSLNLGYLHQLNFAMLHRGVPALYTCQLSNEGEEAWQHVRLSIEAGEWLKPCTCLLETIEAGSTIECNGLKLEPEVQRLLELTEGLRVPAILTIEISGVQALRVELDLQLMPYNHWTGIGAHPDLLASFVTPNHPCLSPVCVEAARFVEKWTGTSALTEYQTQDPNVARIQVAAIYEALRSQALVYATPPASFEQTGQRIRLVDQVLSEKLGTCLDLTLLFASCLEAIGLHPLLVLLKGHIFVGAWLEDKYYTSTIGDDPSFLLKGIADGVSELVLVECTALTSSGDIGFEQAVEQAVRQLHKQDYMELFVDVYRCRLSGIRPLPQRSLVQGQWQIKEQGIQHTNATDSLIAIERMDETELQKPTTLTKQMLWERKLLDLSLRNSLINIRLGKRIIPFISFDIASIEDQLQAGKQYTISPCPSKDIVSADASGIYHSAQYTDQLAPLITKEIQAGRIYSFLDEADLSASLKFIYRTSRSALEENGANSLFVALGLLKWFETELSVRPRYAPILLLPVDIIRKGGGYTIRLRDEDLMLNITLVELLKQEFGLQLAGLDPLPHDENGVDVRKVLAIVRSHIRDKKGWDVLEESMLGLFSFSKFVMWHDVHSNASKLISHPIVRGLMNQSLATGDLLELPEIDAREVDATHSPEEFALPIDVDSSQLEAVLEAGQGRSFVLHGPPGTGKSQTITNMIANALYQGKRVLFVAEKMAALSVVQRRLEKIGLDPFCLELHSNKATKSHILAQLKQALELEHYLSSPEFERTSAELLASRQELIAYTHALHQRHGLGLSLYDCISRYLWITTEALPASHERVRSMDAEDFEHKQSLILESDTVQQISGEPSLHPLRGLLIEQYGLETANELRRSLEQWRALWESLFADEVATLAGRLGFELSDSRASYIFFGTLAEAIHTAPILTLELLRLPQDEQASIEQLIEAGMRRDELRRSLTSRYSTALLEEDAETLAAQWRSVEDKWFLPRFFARRAYLKRLRRWAPSISLEEVAPLLEDLCNYRSLGLELQAGNTRLVELFGSLTSRAEIPWTTMQESMQVARRLYLALTAYTQSQGLLLLDVLQGMRQTLGAEYALMRDSLAPQLASISETIQALRDVEVTLTTKYQASLPEEGLRNSLPALATRWLDNLGKLKDWYQWCAYRRKLIDNGLEDVVLILEAGSSAQEASEAFARGVYRCQAEMIMDADERLKLFNGLLFEQAIERYRTLTKKFMELTKHELYVRLASRVPRMTMEPVASSEMGILKRNIGNGGRGTSIRKLLDQIPNLLSRLCPCMLMSPMSAAQYIDLGAEPFDLVIFDEASQMPTSEAVGAIARGRSLVVVGDPKQMPPTSFFASSQVDEEEVELDDMESILDDCIALSMPSRYLTWHYRSKHESLIAFSNRNYYDGRLFTFPSVDNRQSKVTLIPVNGTYDKGRTRSNKAEANAIVSEVLRRLRDPELVKRSIGIVSFSQVQQNLIEDLLLEALAKEPELETLAFDTDEPIFIKNLENVQGDERDVILFSIGYGPDASGRVSMNFGPLNNKGGERRLNVAVSRSRYEMLVFSTLRSEQIDLKRTQAKGVEGLKRFLEFAERGRLSEVQTSAGAGKAHAGSALATIVAEELRSRGYQVDLSVGSSQFRVDLGVVDPKHPEQYLLGILFDGDSYHETKTTRDREIVQPTVLGLLKWQIMRVWSVDWYEDKERVLARILERIERPETAPKAEIEPFIPTKVLAPESPTPLNPSVNNRREVAYKTTEIKTRQGGDLEKMLSSTKLVSQQVDQIIRTEQPITSSLLAKRLVSIWQIPRVTSRVQSLLESILIDYYLDPRSTDTQQYYWADIEHASSYTSYRMANGRDILDCPLIEVMNAARAVLEEQIAMSEADLKRTTAHLLGFSRMGGNLEAMTQTALDTLVHEGIVKRSDGLVRLVE